MERRLPKTIYHVWWLYCSDHLGGVCLVFLCSECFCLISNMVNIDSYTSHKRKLVRVLSSSWDQMIWEPLLSSVRDSDLPSHNDNCKIYIICVKLQVCFACFLYLVKLWLYTLSWSGFISLIASLNSYQFFSSIFPRSLIHLLYL